jgi:hypothetical protein
MGEHQAAVPARAAQAKRRLARVPDRAALTGILFVLKSGIAGSWSARCLGWASIAA